MVIGGCFKDPGFTKILLSSEPRMKIFVSMDILVFGFYEYIVNILVDTFTKYW